MAGSGFPDEASVLLCSLCLAHPVAVCLAGQAPADLPPDHPRNLGQGGFFASLCWQGTAKPLP